MSQAQVLIMAGGTGGHIYPALAVARELSRRGAQVTWLGTQRGMESRVVPEAGYPIDYISISGLRGNGVLGWVLAPFRITAAVFQAISVIRRRAPGSVLGMGGFVTGPGGVAARLLGKPLIIHEQNAIAGLTNRLLSRIANRVLEAFPGTFGKGVGAEGLGNPVRADIVALPAPAERFAGREQRLRLLVVGGSLGAVALNQAVPQALAMLSEGERPEVIHQTGERNLQQARTDYQAAGVEADVRPFITDMAEAYGWADLVVCRAGALTVSELAAAGLPSLLVPYPYAVDDHQSANARYLVDAGAAYLVQQDQLSAEKLAAVLREMVVDAASGRTRLLAMAEAAHARAMEAAAERVASICLGAADGVAGERNNG